MNTMNPRLLGALAVTLALGITACSTNQQEAIRNATGVNVAGYVPTPLDNVDLSNPLAGIGDAISSIGSFEMVADDARLTPGDKEWLAAQGYEVPGSGLVQDISTPAYNRLVTQRYASSVPPWYDGDAARYEVTQRAALTGIRLGQSGGKVGRQYIEGTIAQGAKAAARNNARNKALGQARDAGLRNVGGN